MEDSNRYDPNTSEFIKKLIYNVDIYKLVSITRSSDMQYFDVEEWINQINLKVRIGYNQIKKNSNSEILKKNCCIAINFYMDLIKSAINSSNLINDHKTYSINGLQEYWNEHMNIDVYECKRLNNMFPDLAKCILQKLRDDKYKTENENKTEDYIKTEWEVIFNNAVLCVKSFITAEDTKIIKYEEKSSLTNIEEMTARTEDSQGLVILGILMSCLTLNKVIENSYRQMLML